MSYFRPEIAAMGGYVPAELPLKDGFIRLNTNENPYRCSTAVAAALEAAVRTGLQDYPDPMARVFRQKAAEMLHTEPDCILCGNGSDDILAICLRAFVGGGQLVRWPYPSYVYYSALATTHGVRSDEVRFGTDWALPDRFAASTADLRLAILCNPNSPSGTVIPPERILRLAERLPCPLLIDEAYADFAGMSCLHLIAENEKILVSRSMSKSYALAGIRFGFVVAQPGMIRQLAKVKAPYNCNALAIAAATAAVGDQAWLVETRTKICGARDRLRSGMLKLGFDIPASRANFTWNCHREHPAKRLYEQLRQERILVRHLDYPKWGDGLRISVGTEAEIEACLDTLRAVV